MSSMSNINKNAIDSQLYVNCTFDMDYLEITKNESLRKYEENVYLLGTIFSTKENLNVNGEKLNSNNSQNFDTEMKIDEDQVTGLSLSEKEILSLFNSHKHHHSEEFTDHFEEDRIKRMISDLQSEIESEKKLLENISQNEILNKKILLLAQLQNSMKDLKEHETILKNNKTLFKESTSKFQDYCTKMRNIKTHQNEEFFNETMKGLDEAGILSETYKQFDNYIRERHRYDHEIPFDPSSNVVIMPL
jgi:hypothetical protein